MHFLIVAFNTEWRRTDYYGPFSTRQMAFDWGDRYLSGTHSWTVDQQKMLPPGIGIS